MPFRKHSKEYDNTPPALVHDRIFHCLYKTLRLISHSDIMSITRHLSVSGKVQGVFFRESMRAEAERLGVAGWVRNRSDGTVEAVVQGTPDAVAAIILWTQRGAGMAQVAKVNIAEIEGGGEIYLRFDKLQSM